MPSVFMRGEYEFMHFSPREHASLYMHTIRAGAGLKF
jgi:hypothetical protein